MAGGKQKIIGRGVFFETTMRGAVMKKVRGQSFRLDVLEKIGLLVTVPAMRGRFAQIDAERASKRTFFYEPEAAALKGGEEARGVEGSDVLLQGRGSVTDTRHLHRWHEAEDGDMGESAETEEVAEEESEDEYELVCDNAACEYVDCDGLWHRDCIVPKDDRGIFPVEVLDDVQFGT